MYSEIIRRENEKQCIAMLGAQRALYGSAKNFEFAKLLVAVILPLILSFVALYFSENTIIGASCYSASVSGIVVCFFLKKSIKNKKELAATIQQNFDSYVYAMPWNTILFGKKKNLDAEIVEYSRCLLSKKDEVCKLANWYPDKSNVQTLEEGILLCQRENCWWDISLRKRYKKGVWGVLLFMIFFVLSMGITYNESVTKLLWRVAFVIPMIQWSLETVDNLDNDIERLVEISEVVNVRDDFSMSDLQDIQKLIFEHRKTCLVIPDIIYSFFRNEDEDKSQKVALFSKK